MQSEKFSKRAGAAVWVGVLVAGICGWASQSVWAGGRLRVVDWNIEADINGVTTPRAGFNTVLQGMGNETINGKAQPIDIMALEETTSNSTTVAPILTMLNGDYPWASYQMSSVQGTQSGSNAFGNGPNAVVYNANTVTLLSSVGIGTPTGSGNGMYRQCMRYQFQPVVGTGSFYIYVSHMKSGTNASDATSRGKEAALIRQNEATLPANSSVIYMGDFNADPTEAYFANLTSAGQGQGVDPLNSANDFTTWTQSSTSLRYRDDYQLMTQNIFDGTGSLTYVPGSLRAFGNNGTTFPGGNTNQLSNTAFSYMTAAAGYSPTGSQLLQALTTASDHLPNIAEYYYPYVVVPEPAGFGVVVFAGLSLMRRVRPAGR